MLFSPSLLSEFLVTQLDTPLQPASSQTTISRTIRTRSRGQNLWTSSIHCVHLICMVGSPVNAGKLWSALIGALGGYPYHIRKG